MYIYIVYTRFRHVDTPYTSYFGGIPTLLVRICMCIYLYIHTFQDEYYDAKIPKKKRCMVRFFEPWDPVAAVNWEMEDPCRNAQRCFANIWVFPKIRLTPNHTILIEFSIIGFHYKPSIIGFSII